MKKRLFSLTLAVLFLFCSFYPNESIMARESIPAAEHAAENSIVKGNTTGEE